MAAIASTNSGLWKLSAGRNSHPFSACRLWSVFHAPGYVRLRGSRSSLAPHNSFSAIVPAV